MGDEILSGTVLLQKLQALQAFVSKLVFAKNRTKRPNILFGFHKYRGLEEDSYFIAFEDDDLLLYEQNIIEDIETRINDRVFERIREVDNEVDILEVSMDKNNDLICGGYSFKINAVSIARKKSID
ncbi:hypothetical protein Fot_07259 [Forsythia ovata]|uniref:Uncharacterized protein n=1 Tax=Forsythia ovata TaxID=205694 RepID=A0ABD1WZG4_9LAMI